MSVPSTLVPSTLAQALERFEPVIGLEVHAQLLTKTKLFTPAPNLYEPDHPNAHVSAYCIGLPGVLPVLNRAAVEMAIKAGLALECEIRPTSVWSRKQYFYPDLPKGYQISQYDKPICEHGWLEVQVGPAKRRISITRIHLEEDAGKSIHVEGSPVSLLDFDRAGVPLCEIVSGPDLRSAQEASAYLKALRAILVTLGVNDGNLEEGSFRCDANVSIRERGTLPFGTRVELKNINSFRYVEQAIEVEILRHAKVIASGGKIELETRLYDSQKRETRSMRKKEEAHDYRYFPDPDLPPLVLEAGLVERIKGELPELPAKKLERYLEVLKIPEEHARTFVEEPEVARFFDSAVKAHPGSAVGIANLIKGEVLRELKDRPEAIKEAKLRPEDLGALVALKDADKISSTQQKKILEGLWTGAKLDQLLESAGEQIDDEAQLGAIIDEILKNSPSEVEKFRQGRNNLMGFFVGQVMKATGGKAKPPLVKALLEKKLSLP